MEQAVRNRCPGTDKDSSYNVHEAGKDLPDWRYENEEKYWKQSGTLPTPLVVVGTMVQGKPNYVLVGHVGIIGHDRIKVSLAKPHYTNQGIKETRSLTVNIVDEAMLKKADRTGCVSRNKVDKSERFQFHTEVTGAPVIDEAPVVMDCTVDGIYETERLSLGSGEAEDCVDDVAQWLANIGMTEEADS